MLDPTNACWIPLTQGQMVPAFDGVCWIAPLMEVQGPVETQFGHHLILVTAREDGEGGSAKTN
jgi:parvulin-like peptidyl-prolyl isomerase